MNQKKAKQLRKLARACSVGLPETGYVGEQDRRDYARRHHGYIPSSMREGTRKLLDGSTRAVYHELKRSFYAGHVA